MESGPVDQHGAATDETARAVIVSENYVEAADLREALALHDISPSLHLRSADRALTYLSAALDRPRVIIFGVEMSDAMGLALLDYATECGIPVIIISSDTAEATGGGRHLQRPFGEGALNQALSALAH